MRRRKDLSKEKSNKKLRYFFNGFQTNILRCFKLSFDLLRNDKKC